MNLRRRAPLHRRIPVNVSRRTLIAALGLTFSTAAAEAATTKKKPAKTTKTAKAPKRPAKPATTHG